MITTERLASSMVGATTKTVSVACDGPHLSGRLCRIDSSCDARSDAGLRLDHDQIVCPVDLCHKFGHHALQMRVFRQDADAFWQLSQTHI